jgi:Ca2+-binding RTX toxin-like protein
MSLLSGFNVTLAEVGLLGEAALAAFAGGAIPAGWNVITPQQLGVSSQFWDGIYFTNDGASAIVLQQGNNWIVSFRGADGPDDILRYPELEFGTYINHFQPLLNAVALNAPEGTHFSFTGASLGGGATNQMANIVGSQFAGEFASATFVAFASPIISTAHGILNLGFENDPIYKALSGYNDFPSSLDNLVLATSQYMGGNYDGLHPPDDYAHNAALSSAALAQLQSSVFFDQMNPDSVVVFDAFSGVVQDITPGRENTGAFYLGQNVADMIVGRNGDDHIEGFAGDDTLVGGAGNDVLAGGANNDVIYGNLGADVIYGNLDQDTLFGGQVNDTVYGGQGNDVVYGNLGDDVIYGNLANDNLFGGQGNDTLFGGQGNDTINGNFGNDILFGNQGADRFVFGQGAGADVVMNFNFGEGDRLDVQGQTHATSTAADGWALITLSGGGTIELVEITPAQISDSFFV